MSPKSPVTIKSNCSEVIPLSSKNASRVETAAGAIGYKELLGFIHGEMTLEAASELLKMATRRYAKRQCTWFGAKSYIERIDIDGSPDEKIFEKIVKNTKKVFQLS